MRLPETAPEAAAREALAGWDLQVANLGRLAGGLINQSFCVEADTGQCYVLQRLHPVFAPEVNDNIERVTEALAARGAVTPRVLRTRGGQTWLRSGESVWRVLTFIEGQGTDALHTPPQAAAAGELLGRFHALLADWPDELPHVRASVHEPARHFNALQSALDTHAGHRLHAEVARLAEALFARAAALPPWPEAPRRLVHGDPKISNLLFDAGGRGLCLVDLDTLARGPLVPELGDAFRSWCNPGPEDAPTPSFSLPLFEAALGGYATHGRQFMTREERTALVAGVATIYLELVARFAADALNEAYFGWDPARFPSCGAHNLARAHNQWLAAEDLARQQPAAEAVVERVLG